MKKIICLSGNEMLNALSNVCFMGRCDAMELDRALRHTDNIHDFVMTARKMTGLEWERFDETDEMVIARWTDRLGNKKYLKGIK